MAIRKKLQKPVTKSQRNHQLAIIRDREQEPVRNLLPIPTQAVAHVLASNVVHTKEPKKLPKRDQINEEVHHLFMNELCETSECLADQCQCNSRNVLHSTATESELAQPSNEYCYVGNILGVKDLSVTSCDPDKRLLKEPEIVRSHAEKATYA